MRKIRTFWYVFRQSLTNPEYYQDILKTNFGFSLQYLFLLLFLIFLLRGVLFSGTILSIFPKMPEYVSQAKTIVKELYPNELVLTMKDGTLRTNVDEPYVVPFPKSMNLSDYSFAVIDTKSSVENIKKYKTLLFVTKNAFAYPDSNSSSGYKVQFFSDVKSYSVFNRQTYDQIIGKLLPYFQYASLVVVLLAIFALVLFPLIGAVFSISSTLVFLFLLTLIIYFIAKLMKKQMPYMDLYRLSIHGITFSLIFDLFKSFFSISIPFTFIMPYIIWMMIVLNAMKIPYGQLPTSQRSAKQGRI